MNTISYLKQARRSTNLTLQDMAYLLDMDFSNLSKYEMGKKTPPARVIIAYHIVTKTPLKKLFRYRILGIIDTVTSRTTSLISQLEEETGTPKLKERISNLYEILNNIGCLQEVSGEEDDR